MRNNILGHREPASNLKKSSRRTPSALRTARMHFEMLESRALLAGLDEAPADADSDVLQASLMSVFFQQSALYENRQPTSDPTVTWVSHIERDAELLSRVNPGETLDRVAEAVHLELSQDVRKVGPAMQSNLGGRATSGIRRLIHVELGWPAHVYAPYVDLSNTPFFDFVQTAVDEGVLYYNLASIVADAHNRPAWGGDPERAVDGGSFDFHLRDKIHQLRAMGGDVAVSFGGASGRDLAEAIVDPYALKDAYHQVVDAYGLQRIDFDLSSTALQDGAAVERRWQAAGVLQRELAEQGVRLEVWVTLPADRNGLSGAALEAVRSAGLHGLRIDGVNLKTDYSRAEDLGGHRTGRLNVESTVNAYYQLRSMLLPDADTGTVWPKLGVTPTVETGSADGELTPRDARELAGFAREQGVGMIGIWSLDRARPEAHPPAEGPPDVIREITEIFRAFGEAVSR